MSREIKFRAWDKDEEKMREVLQIDFSNLEVHYTDWYTFIDRGQLSGARKKGIDWNDISHVVLMQYTGLKDKNGVEIYEGDIIRILYTDWASKSDDDPRTLEQYMNDLAVLGSVVFRSPRFVCDLKDNTDCSLIPGTHGFIEVIGNIYENKELLDE